MMVVLPVFAESCVTAEVVVYSLWEGRWLCQYAEVTGVPGCYCL